MALLGERLLADEGWGDNAPPRATREVLAAALGYPTMGYTYYGYAYSTHHGSTHPRCSPPRSAIISARPSRAGGATYPPNPNPTLTLTLTLALTLRPVLHGTARLHHYTTPASQHPHPHPTHISPGCLPTQCNNCGARRSVQPIKTGFVAISKGARKKNRQ